MTDQAKLEKPHQRENRTLHRPRHNVGVSACAYLPLDGNSTWRSTRPTTALCEQFDGGDEETERPTFLSRLFHPFRLCIFSPQRILNFLWKRKKKMRGSRFGDEEWIPFRNILLEEPSILESRLKRFEKWIPWNLIEL